MLRSANALVTCMNEGMVDWTNADVYGRRPQQSAKGMKFFNTIPLSVIKSFL